MEKTNFFYLLGALLFLLLALPLAHDFGLADMPIMRVIVFSVLLLVGSWSLKDGGRYFSSGMLFVVSGIASSVLAASLDMMLFEYGAILAMIGFLVVAISYTLGQVVFGTEMSANRLVGAICVFLLLGIIWAFGYALLELAAPNSFKGFDPAHAPGADST